MIPDRATTRNLPDAKSGEWLKSGTAWREPDDVAVAGWSTRAVCSAGDVSASFLFRSGPWPGAEPPRWKRVPLPPRAHGVGVRVGNERRTLLLGMDREQVMFRHIGRAEPTVGGLYRADPGQPQLLRQSVLQR
jgi:hypothetical protein